MWSVDEISYLTRGLAILFWECAGLLVEPDGHRILVSPTSPDSKHPMIAAL